MIGAAAVGLGMMSPVGAAVAGLYGIASVGVSAATSAVGITVAGAVALNKFLNEHIEGMKESDNPTISRTGRIFEMAKFGFGIGWGTGIAIIAAGQLILGNNLFTSVVTVASSPINPVALTCAAMGAVYYGWNALSDEERTEILEKLSKGLDVGVAFITSIIEFVLNACRKVFSSENLEELKKIVGNCAAQFGKTLSSITHKLTDVVSDSYSFIKKKTEGAYDTTKEAAGNAYDVVAEAAENVSSTIKDKLRSSKD